MRHPERCPDDMLYRRPKGVPISRFSFTLSRGLTFGDRKILDYTLHCRVVKNVLREVIFPQRSRSGVSYFPLMCSRTYGPSPLVTLGGIISKDGVISSI